MKRRFPRIRTIEPDRAVGFRPTIIDRGAELLGLSRTEFMRRAALHEAQAAILNETVIRVSPEAYDAFMQAISAPAAAPPAPTPTTAPTTAKPTDVCSDENIHDNAEGK